MKTLTFNGVRIELCAVRCLPSGGMADEAMRHEYITRDGSFTVSVNSWLMNAVTGIDLMKPPREIREATKEEIEALEGQSGIFRLPHPLPKYVGSFKTANPKQPVAMFPVAISWEDEGYLLRTAGVARRHATTPTEEPAAKTAKHAPYLKGYHRAKYIEVSDASWTHLTYGSKPHTLMHDGKPTQAAKALMYLDKHGPTDETTLCKAVGSVQSGEKMKVHRLFSSARRELLELITHRQGKLTLDIMTG